MSNPIPGWYPDPTTPGMDRWWDGEQWTEQRQPGAGAPPAPPTAPMAPPMAAPVAPLPYAAAAYGGYGVGVPKASYGARIGSAIIDYVLTWGLYIVGSLVAWTTATQQTYTAGAICPPSRPNRISFCVNGEVTEYVPPAWFGPVLGLSMLVALGVFIANKGLRQGSRGQTLGKKTTGVALVDVDTLLPVGAGRAMGRTVVFLVLSTLTCYIFALVDVVFPLFDVRGQRVVDKMFRTRVVPAGSANLPT